MVRALSIPRPAYSAAHSPAGPAPTMMTSYSRVPFSDMCSEFQSRGIALPPQGPRQLRAELNCLKLDIGLLRAGELVEGRRSDDHRAVAVAARPMQECGGGLNQALHDPRFVLLNNRTPDGFQRLMGQSILAPVEQIASVLQVAAGGGGGGGPRRRGGGGAARE